jgi:hypothetical protein
MKLEKNINLRNLPKIENIEIKMKKDEIVIFFK